MIKGDIRDKNTVKQAIHKANAVIHLAALTDIEQSVKNPLETHDVNVNGTLNLLNEAAKNNIQKFLFASSTAVYGEDNPLPLKENYPPKPISPYGASKASAEHYCTAFHRTYRLPTIILRYFNVYGPRQEKSTYSGVITKFLNNAKNNRPLVIYGNGEQTRDFVHVEDIVNATLLALESNRSNGQILNVCTGKPTSINQLVHTLKGIIPKNLQIKHAKPRKGDILNNYGNPTKAKKTLEFKTQINLKEGLLTIIIDYL